MDRPIGLLDSGVGGLTVANELIRQLPKEQLIYIGDTLRCPYGPRTEDEVRQYTNELVDFLVSKNVKMVVVACNTATAFTLEELKGRLNIPVIGVIQPGARAAIKLTESNEVGIIGTEGTINSQAYEQALRRINEQIKTYALACTPFVPLVESGQVEGKQVERIVKETLEPLLDKANMDTLILGCTHYPLLESVIKQTLHRQVKVISSGEETAREVSTILEHQNLLNQGKHNERHQFYATGDMESFQEIAHLIFQNSHLDENDIDFENVRL
ncbi:MAG TPA: glutamate racemase [Pseudogracilibacillus sp.]|nr:glutamate racemase [Pseudogracilibacillus sp.]